MAHQAQSANSLLLLCILILHGCTARQEPMQYYNFTTLQPEQKDGLLLEHGKPFTGIIYSLAANGRDTLQIMGFSAGREHGEWRKYYGNGKLAEQRHYTHGVKTGDYKAWWENGKPKAAWHFEQGEYEGALREWNPQGRLVVEMHYHNGYESGSQKVYYDNGRIKTNYLMIDGRRYGLLGTKNCVNVSDSIFKR